MDPYDALPLLVFLAVVTGVMVGAAWALARRVLVRWGRATPAIGRQDDILLATAACGLVCMAYGYAVEPFWPEVTHVRLKSPKLHGGEVPLRLVHLSDLHCDAEPRLEERLPDLVAQEKPDAIIFSGDSLNSAAGLPIFKRCLTRLAAIAPTFAVRGNWDTHFWAGLDLFGGTGAKELGAVPIPVRAHGHEVWLTGAAADDTLGVSLALQAQPPGGYGIFVHHYPDMIEEAARRGVDLFCAGHTHGGQVALPFYGALITMSRFGKRFEGGLYRVERTWLYVNRGIGMEGGHAPRVRFCARPEITVIELNAK